MKCMARAMVALAMVAGIGCAERTPPAEEPLIDLDDPEVNYRSSDSAHADAPPSDATEQPRLREGTVSREALDQVLAAGPGALLAQLPVSAVVEKGKFRGWQVQAAPFEGVDLLAGDVVLGVNGRTLQHPLELKLLWDELRKADHIAVDVKRSEARFTLRFVVLGGSAGAEARDMVAP